MMGDDRQVSSGALERARIDRANGLSGGSVLVAYTLMEMFEDRDLGGIAIKLHSNAILS